jgi:hypothetical protein
MFKSRQRTNLSYCQFRSPSPKNLALPGQMELGRGLTSATEIAVRALEYIVSMPAQVFGGGAQPGISVSPAFMPDVKVVQ